MCKHWKMPTGETKCCLIKNIVCFFSKTAMISHRMEDPSVSVYMYTYTYLCLYGVCAPAHYGFLFVLPEQGAENNQTSINVLRLLIQIGWQRISRLGGGGICGNSTLAESQGQLGASLRKFYHVSRSKSKSYPQSASQSPL